jgi:mono/diheme cytochrome c family protein
VPSGNLRGDAAAGAKTYQLYCSTCHGKEGKGDGPAALVDPKPADHSDAVYMGSLSDAQLYTVITKGGPAVGKSPLMAPWGAVLSAEQTRDVIAYVRSLSGT